MITKNAIQNRINALNTIYNDDTEVIVVKAIGIELEDKFYNFADRLSVKYGKTVEIVDTFGDKTSFAALNRTTAPAWVIVKFLESLEAPARDLHWEPEVFPMNKNDLPEYYKSTVKENEEKGYTFASYEDDVLTFIKGENGKRAFSFSCDNVEKECVVTYYNLLNADGERVGELKEIIF